MSRLITAFLVDWSKTINAAMDQRSLSGYELSNEDTFWLAQVAEDGSLPNPNDEKLARKLQFHGLVEVRPKSSRRRDQSLDQVYFLTYRGDVMMRAYQAYRARHA